MTVSAEPKIDLLSGEFWGGDFHAAMTWMRQNDPLHFDGRVWGATTYELVKDISRQPELFTNSKGIRPDSDALPMMIVSIAICHVYVWWRYF